MAYFAQQNPTSASPLQLHTMRYRQRMIPDYSSSHEPTTLGGPWIGF
jgi:hypothetical protein